MRKQESRSRLRPEGAKPPLTLNLIVAAASTRSPIPLIREAWVPIRISGIATVPSAKRICQTLRAR